VGGKTGLRDCWRLNAWLDTPCGTNFVQWLWGQTTTAIRYKQSKPSPIWAKARRRQPGGFFVSVGNGNRLNNDRLGGYRDSPLSHKSWVVPWKSVTTSALLLRAFVSADFCPEYSAVAVTFPTFLWAVTWALSFPAFSQGVLLLPPQYLYVAELIVWRSIVARKMPPANVVGTLVPASVLEK